MPSKKARPLLKAKASSSSGRDRATTPKVVGADSVLFYPLVVLMMIMWGVYRARLQFPVVIDETIGKAIFFGFPVWMYVSIVGARSIPDTFRLGKLKSGLLLGVAFGGIFGFAASVMSFLGSGRAIEPVYLFAQNSFWWEFFLSLLTGFWETLFFFSWMMVVIQEKHRSWSLVKQVIWVATLFTIFHIPNSFLRYQELRFIVPQIFLMFIFSLGQAFVFARNHNAYTLVVSHSIWGMVLLLHLGFP
jgi:hypothetical protein